MFILLITVDEKSQLKHVSISLNIHVQSWRMDEAINSLSSLVA